MIDLELPLAAFAPGDRDYAAPGEMVYLATGGGPKVLLRGFPYPEVGLPGTTRMSDSEYADWIARQAAREALYLIFARSAASVRMYRLERDTGPPTCCVGCSRAKNRRCELKLPNCGDRSDYWCPSHLPR